MLTIILIIFWVLFLLSFFMKINTPSKIKLLNHILALAFLLITIFSINNLLNWNVIEFSKIFFLWNLENYFLMIFWFLGFTISFYSDFYFGEYLKHGKNLKFYYILFLLFIFSMLGVIAANEAITFLIFWEIMSVSSYFLVVHEANKKGILKDWAWYFIITHIWMFFILLSFIPFILKSGSTFFSNWSAITLSTSLASFAFFTALIWFWSKAWLFPIHIWLPKAHPIAPTNVSALMSGFMVKLPVLMILKFLLIFVAMKVQFSWFIVTLLIASISAFIWIFYAIRQKNIKKLLAYSTIENIWIIFLGISIAILWLYLKNNYLFILWIYWTLFHSFNHAVFKWLMFMLAWWVIERTWTYEYTKLWWIIKKFPFLWISFLIWSLAIAWILPLNWFNSEFLIFLGLFKSSMIQTWIFWKISILVSVIALSATAVLSLITFVQLFWQIFLWNKRDNEIKYKDIKSIWENISYTISILLIFALAIFPWIIYLFVTKILNIKFEWSIFNFWNLNLHYTPIYIFIAILIFGLISYLFYKKLSTKAKKMPVWNCWYNYIEPKTQYSTTSFNQPIRRIFTSLYGETKKIKKVQKKWTNNSYKKNLEYIEYTINNKYFVENFYEQVLNIIWKIAKKIKSLQNWQVQSYIFYMFLALLLLILIVLFNNK